MTAGHPRGNTLNSLITVPSAVLCSFLATFVYTPLKKNTVKRKCGDDLALPVQEHSADKLS